MDARKSLISIAVILLLSSALLIPLTSADPATHTYLGKTSTGQLVDRTVLFNCDWEREDLNAIPRVGHIGTDQDNLTVSIVYSAGCGKVLKIDKNGTLKAVNPKLVMNTGHWQASGVVDFEFDVNLVAISSTAHGIQLNYGSTYAVSTEHVLQFVKYNATHALIDFYDAAAYVKYEQWTHVLLRYDFTAQQIGFYVDDILLDECDALITGLGIINFAVMNIDSVAHGLFDNLTVSVHIPAIYPVMIPDGRNAVMVNFDDANIHDLTVALPILGDAPATSNLYVGDIGDANRLNWTNVQQLVDAGWDIFSHSLDHLGMTSITDSEIRRQFELSKRYIEENTTAEVTGWVYPYNSYSYHTDVIGWDYYDLLAGGTPYDGIPRVDSDVMNSTIGGLDAPYYGMYRLMRTMPAAIYGVGSYVAPYFHAIVDSDYPVYGCNETAFRYYITELKSEGAWFTTPSKIAEYARNALNVELSGNISSLSVSYPVDRGNYASNDSVYVHISGGFSAEEYVVVDANGRRVGGSYTPIDGNLTVVLHTGEFSLMSLSDYRSFAMTESISTIAMIIPVIVVVSLISALSGFTRRV